MWRFFSGRFITELIRTTPSVYGHFFHILNCDYLFCCLWPFPENISAMRDSMSSHNLIATFSSREVTANRFEVLFKSFIYIFVYMKTSPLIFTVTVLFMVLRFLCLKVHCFDKFLPGQSSSSKFSPMVLMNNILRGGLIYFLSSGIAKTCILQSCKQRIQGTFRRSIWILSFSR